MTTATARKPNRRCSRDTETDAAPKSTAYGRAVLRGIDRMKAAGPWEFGRKLSERYFKR
jgi:hypothetical protein